MALNVPAKKLISEAFTKIAHKYPGVVKYDETWIARVRVRSFEEIRDQVEWVCKYGQEGLDSVLLNTKARWISCERAAATAAVSVPISVVAAAANVIVPTVKSVTATEWVAEVLTAPVEKKEVVESVVGTVVVGELDTELLSEVEAECEGNEIVAAELREEENQNLPALVPADSGADMSEPCSALVAIQI
ncbi:hypothetical protein GGF31_000075 [Allomyces arbusculus]|nr:hypothetical protein GGF31_000075 [Allomyces arbusculus]